MRKDDVVQGRYHLEERLGRGGMGEVWRARDDRLQRTVALKLISPGLAEDPEFLVRFLREAQNIARITHPNVVGVIDFGEDDEKPFLVMEYVPGKPVSELTGEPMEESKARAIVTQAAEAAGAAHDQGIVHRDIKPANILLTDDGRAKLVDFGIASAQHMDRVTQTGVTIGSPHYISPEQASGQRVKPQSDVYSLGIVLYELLTGKKPFEAASVAAVAMAQLENDPEPPRSHVPDMDPRLEAVILRCLEKDPEKRYADGSELARAISTGEDARTAPMGAAGAAAGAGIASAAAGPGTAGAVDAGGAPGGQTLIMGSADDAPPDGEGRYVDDEDSPWRAILAGALIGLVLLALVLGAYALLSSDTGIQTDTPVPGSRDVTEGEQPAQETTPTEEPVVVPEDPATEEEEPPPSSEPPPEEEESGEEDEEDKEDEEIEGEVETGGRGPDGEGPPGQEKKGEG
ncbi:MAG: serine/threonine protein kinase [Actinomycetota bacterium]|nr:serine/threonine protein kinase [Actinomycetota bacterium]